MMNNGIPMTAGQRILANVRANIPALEQAIAESEEAISVAEMLGHDMTQQRSALVAQKAILMRYRAAVENTGG